MIIILNDKHHYFQFFLFFFLQKIIDEMEIEITELKEQHEIQLNQLKEKYIAMKKFCETQKKHIKFLKEKETDAK